MKKSLMSVFLALIATAVLVSIVYGEPREEIRLTTIIPDQQVLRVKKGIISTTNYRQADFPDGNIPAKSLIIEGNVGIGTTNPLTKLEFDDVAAGSDVRIHRKAIVPHAAGNVPSTLGLSISDGSEGGVFIVDERNTSGTYNNQYVRFNTHEGGISAGERMRIAPNGNVGIGVTSPTSAASPANSVATGNLDVNDVYLRSTSTWASAAGGGSEAAGPTAIGVALGTSYQISTTRGAYLYLTTGNGQEGFNVKIGATNPPSVGVITAQHTDKNGNGARCNATVYVPKKWYFKVDATYSSPGITAYYVLVD